MIRYKSWWYKCIAVIIILIYFHLFILYKDSSRYINQSNDDLLCKNNDVNGSLDDSVINNEKLRASGNIWPSISKMEKYFIPEGVLVLGKRRSYKGLLVFGIPTVQRKGAYYLMQTIKELIDEASDVEQDEILIVVLIADSDVTYQEKVRNDIEEKYFEELRDGLIQVIIPPPQYYPPLDNLPILYKDSPSRVKWRSKQCLDYSYMFFYCAELAEYYIQLEDDIRTVPGYVSSIKNFIKLKENKNWAILEFGARGFIGMTYRTKHLKKLARYIRFYYWTMPVDWLFRLFNEIYLDTIYTGAFIKKPPLFKHIGKYSSLDGQKRKLEDVIPYDKAYRDMARRRFQVKRNPQAVIKTSITSFVYPFDITKPYGNDDFFWGKHLQDGDNISIKFKQSIKIKRIIFVSGSKKYPYDTFHYATLLISHDESCKQYVTLATFNDTRILDYKFSISTNQIQCIKLELTKIKMTIPDVKNWLLISEIAIFT